MPEWIKQVDRLLRGDATRVASLKTGGVDVLTDKLPIAVVALGVTYGLCMGLYAILRGDSTALLQLASGMMKVPALFLLTLVVTFPSLYVFNALMGSRLTISAMWNLLLAAIAVNLAVLASFGPIVAFFSLSTTSYSFMLLLNVFMFAVAGVLGLVFLLRTLHRISVANGESTPAVIEEASGGALDPLEGQALGPKVKHVFRLWVIVYGLVGAQMGWVLRPFLGSPDKPFEFVRTRESSFFEAVWHHLQNLF